MQIQGAELAGLQGVQHIIRRWFDVGYLRIILGPLLDIYRPMIGEGESRFVKGISRWS
jgi:hypothetical protein